ncbi:MAG: hypothetical protein ACTSWN_02715 [Promethearchaeota archaeon]
MVSNSNLKSKLRLKTVKAYLLALSDCGGCINHLMAAIKHVPIELVQNPYHADFILIYGVLTSALESKIKDLFKYLSPPYLIIRIGRCLDEFNSSFEDPASNPLIPSNCDDFFPILETIDGCPPSIDKIKNTLNAYVSKFDITPTLNKTLDDKIKKGVFN